MLLRPHCDLGNLAGSPSKNIRIVRIGVFFAQILSHVHNYPVIITNGETIVNGVIDQLRYLEDVWNIANSMSSYNDHSIWGITIKSH